MSNLFSKICQTNYVRGENTFEGLGDSGANYTRETGLI